MVSLDLREHGVLVLEGEVWQELFFNFVDLLQFLQTLADGLLFLFNALSF